MMLLAEVDKLKRNEKLKTKAVSVTEMKVKRDEGG